MSAPQKYCIIGAGCSGFTTAKALQDRNIPFDCFEMSDRIGGNWAFKNKNGRSACYRSLHIDTSKYRLQFKDFPIPPGYPDYPHHAQLLAYFDAYVDHFGLKPKITFNTEVTNCERLPGGDWRVTLSTGESRDYRGVFVCNGHHWDAYTPVFPGTFEGVQFHAHDYVDPFEPVDARGKRILVVGMGNSAMDIASELAQKPIAEQLFVAARRGVWIFPKYIKGKVPDKGAMPLWMPRWLIRMIVKKMVSDAVGKMSDYGLPEPEHHPADQHPSVSGEFLTRVGCGDVKVKPNIERFEGRNIRFTDGSVEQIDIVIYATGYNVSFPFLDPKLIPVAENHIPLFKRIWKPGIENLFFMGLAQPLPTLVNLAEVQAKWVASHIAGDYALPSIVEMQSTIIKDEARDIGKYYKSRRHTMQINFDLYCHEIAQEQKRGAARAQSRKAA